MWRRIWNLKLPNKIKHFVWRVVHNIIAVRGNLWRRGVDINTNCVQCNRVHEDGGHLFLKCKHMREAWALLNLEQICQKLVEQTTAHDVVKVLLSLDRKVQIQSIILMWMWWDDRNKVREGERGRLATELVFAVQIFASEILKEGVHGSRMQLRRIDKWKKPEEGKLKINCDDAFYSEHKPGGWSFIIRDHVGDVIYAGRGVIQHCPDPFHAEIKACVQGVKQALNMGMGHIVVETDAEMVKQAISSYTYDASDAASLIAELKDLLDDNFLSWDVKSVPRSCNSVADALAHAGCVCASEADPEVVGLPDCIQVMVASDLAAPTV
ncbi:hypothetical protein PR202_gb20534 [Eleusine coracana subsp. coracana]|uniref:RNase H type-1 domain-containing protein n=1 Tax=Eleusine coracana subsp. coracana TaxID=191504 RepID=A0AAV5FAP7_ELECO|nr:hypothetical protein PR202_gb20534 [Eleusine coracana subsp. coracana]